MELWTIFLRTIFIYLLILFLLPPMKGDFGRWTPIHLITAVIVAELAVYVIIDVDTPLINGLVPICSVLGLQMLLIRRPWTKKNVEEPRPKTGALATLPPMGERCLSEMPNMTSPLPLIQNGRVLDENLIRLNKTRFWLKNQVQKHDIRHFRDISFCTINELGGLYMEKKES